MGFLERLDDEHFKSLQVSRLAPCGAANTVSPIAGVMAWVMTGLA